MRRLPLTVSSSAAVRMGVTKTTSPLMLFLATTRAASTWASPRTFAGASATFAAAPSARRHFRSGLPHLADGAATATVTAGVKADVDTSSPSASSSASSSATPSTPTRGRAGFSMSAPTMETLLKERDVPKFDTSYLLPHLVWDQKQVQGVQVTHRPVKGMVDILAYATIKAIRFNFDWMSGWSFGRPTAAKALDRVCFLETVAGCPGSVAATLRHLASLRRMRRDGGWIHTLLEEAENERMHLLAALQLKQPSLGFRSAVFVTQGIFFNFFWMAYLVSPRFCHRLVGYLEEEAVITYTHILEGFDKGYFPEWEGQRAPQIAIDYWRLPKDATIRDMFLSIRLDEAHHRDVNHTFGDLRSTDLNPFRAGE